MVFCLLCIVSPSVLICSNLKLQQTLGAKNIFIQENVMHQLTFNPGLKLTGFRTTRPRLQNFIVFAMTSYLTDDNRTELLMLAKLKKQILIWLSWLAVNSTSRSMYQVPLLTPPAPPPPPPPLFPLALVLLHCHVFFQQ